MRIFRYFAPIISLFAFVAVMPASPSDSQPTYAMHVEAPEADAL